MEFGVSYNDEQAGEREGGSEMILDNVNKVIQSKMKGDNWVTYSLQALVEVSIEMKEIEARKKAECEPFRSAIEDINSKYKVALDVLTEMDIALRDRVMKEHQGTESVKVEGVGEFVFPETWGFEIVDVKKVPEEFLTVDPKAIREAIKKGVRNIKGLEIKPIRSLRVLTKS